MEQHEVEVVSFMVICEQVVDGLQEHRCYEAEER